MTPYAIAAAVAVIVTGVAVYRQRRRSPSPPEWPSETDPIFWELDEGSWSRN